MGWWKRDNGDVLGDASADLVSRHMRSLATPPTLGAFLAALGEILRMKSNDLCSDNGPVRQLVADFELDDKVTTVLPDPTVDPALRGALDVLCEEILDAYELEMERRPTQRELVGSFDFVLGHEPERFLSIEEDGSVTEIRIEP